MPHITFVQLPECVPVIALCYPAGLPPNSSHVYCLDRFQSCYWYFSATATYSAAKSTCNTMGGYPVVPNSYEEQLAYEK